MEVTGEVTFSRCSTHLDLVQHGAGLLQGHRLPLLVEVGVAADLLQPAPQLVGHLPVVVPLQHQAVDDAPPLLRPPHHALPLVAKQRQLQAEVLPVGGGAGRGGGAQGSTILMY